MPPVKRLLPPRSSAEAFSSTSTWAPASHAARAAVKAALPAPTTTTSLNSSGSSTLSLRSGYHAGHLSLSDKQDAFVTGIAAEFPGVPHRYCVNHFLRDLAKPMLEADSHAKVTMRSKVRGLRAIEHEVLQLRRPIATAAPAVVPAATTPTGESPAV